MPNLTIEELRDMLVGVTNLATPYCVYGAEMRGTVSEANLEAWEKILEKSSAILSQLISLLERRERLKRKVEGMHKECLDCKWKKNIEACIWGASAFSDVLTLLNE